MSALIWGHWGVEWELEEKVSFNGLTKQITVNSGVTAIDIRSDVYSAWVRWVQREPWALPAMRFSGADVIPGGETGVTFFLINGWKLVYNPSLVAMNGVLYSADYATPYWSYSGTEIYPATVSSLVNSSVSYQNVVTGTALTQEQTANAVWQASTRSLTTDAALLAQIQALIDAVPAATSTAVWDKPVSSMTNTANIGGWLYKKVMTIPRFLGLK